MNQTKNRRLNPRQGSVIALSLLIGAVSGVLAAYGWSQFTMTEMQRSCLYLYAEASCPLWSTLPRNMVRQVVGEPIHKGDHSRVSRKEAYSILHDDLYHGMSLSDLLATPFKLFVGFLFGSFIAGLIVSNRIRRRMENGIRLRGPESMTIDQYNQEAAGKVGMEFEVHDIKY